MDPEGGGAPNADWFPARDRGNEYGHLPYAAFPADGRSIAMTCGPDNDPERERFVSSQLIDRWLGGLYGGFGTAGNPGWAVVSDSDGDAGRGNHYLCGGQLAPGTHGIAYCNGPAAHRWGNHVASYNNWPDHSVIGCAGAEADRFRLWVLDDGP